MLGLGNGPETVQTPNYQQKLAFASAEETPLTSPFEVWIFMIIIKVV